MVTLKYLVTETMTHLTQVLLVHTLRVHNCNGVFETVKVEGVG